MQTPASAAPHDWLPLGTTSVIRSTGVTNPAVMNLSTLGEPCVMAVASELESVYQVQRDPTEKMTFVGFGGAGRDAFEDCARRVMTRLDPLATRVAPGVERDGDVSVLRPPGGRPQFAAFTAGRVVLADSRDKLDAFTTGPTLAQDDPLRALLPRLAGDDLRAVSSLDHAGMLTGVPSLGLVAVASGAVGAATLNARLVFANADDAARFVAFVRALSDSPEADPIARELAAMISPVAEGSEVEVDLARVLSEAMARPEIGAWLERRAAEARDGTRP